MSERPLRRDAERNRQLLLRTAQELMARDGLAVSYEEIARTAGTGMGTLYRRFPERQDLVDALFAEHIDAVVALARRACRADDAWAGLTWFMEQQFELEAGNRGLGELLRGGQQVSDRVAEGCARISALTAELIALAVHAGQLPAGVVPDDLSAVHLMVGAVMDASRQDDPDRWRRALAVALAGLRHAELPSGQLDREAGARRRSVPPTAPNEKAAHRAPAQ